MSYGSLSWKIAVAVVIVCIWIVAARDLGVL